MSLPSGHPFTIIINTIYNAFAIRYCWYRANGNDISILYEFDKYVSFIALGDDSNFSVHPNFAHLFNEMTLPALMAEINLTYTTESKTVAVIPLRFIEEIDFLTRSYRISEEKGVCVAPQQLERILAPLHHTKRGPEADQITMDKVDSSLRELSLHGEEVFNTWAPKVAKASKEKLDYFPKAVGYLINLTNVAKTQNFC
jgi:hypothetical protein